MQSQSLSKNPNHELPAFKRIRKEICIKVGVSQADVCGFCDARGKRRCATTLNYRQTINVQQLLENDMEDEHNVMMLEGRLPRLRLTDIDADDPKDDLLLDLKKNNSQMKQMIMLHSDAAERNTAAMTSKKLYMR